MTRMTLAAATVAALFLLLTVGAPRASADTFNFTSDHCSGGCGTAPFGSVELTQDGNNVDVVVTLNSGNYFVSTGAGDGYYLKLVGAADKTSTYTGSLTVGQFSLGSGLAVVEADSGNNLDGDGTGYFYFGITCSSCGNGNSPH